MDVVALNRRKRTRLSVPGLSLVILALAGSAVLWLAILWLSPAPAIERWIAAILVVGLWIARFSVVSAFSMGGLLILSDGARDYYVPADDLVSVSLGSSFGAFTVVKLSHKKHQLGFTTTRHVRTLVWRSSALDALKQIESLFEVEAG